ncbi:hypothetical protein FRC06_007533 [Ceratobasidium sp. 370]|nr:hypothetical protein FRC06_007533 [Ceratobasidium sp. 370]
MDLLLEIQSESQTEVVPYMPPPKAPQPQRAPKPSYYYEAANSSEEDTNLAVGKPFTAADKADFIRFAAARPNGMEPMAGEDPGDAWKAFTKQITYNRLQRCVCGQQTRYARVWLPDAMIS